MGRFVEYRFKMYASRSGRSGSGGVSSVLSFGGIDPKLFNSSESELFHTLSPSHKRGLFQSVRVVWSGFDGALRVEETR